MGPLSMNAGVFHFDESQADNTIAPQYPVPLKEQILKPSNPPLKRSKEWLQ